MSEPINADDLKALVSKAVEQALKQRGATSKGWEELLGGPLIVGLLPMTQTPFAQDKSFTEGKLAQPQLLSALNPQMIGFVANDLEQLKAEIEKE